MPTKPPAGAAPTAPGTRPTTATANTASSSSSSGSSSSNGGGSGSSTTVRPLASGAAATPDAPVENPVPRQPYAVKLVGVTETTVTASWQAPDPVTTRQGREVPVLRYRVTWSTGVPDTRDNRTSLPAPATHEFTTAGAFVTLFLGGGEEGGSTKPFVRGTPITDVRVFAININGESAASAPTRKPVVSTHTVPTVPLNLRVGKQLEAVEAHAEAEAPAGAGDSTAASAATHVTAAAAEETTTGAAVDVAHTTATPGSTRQSGRRQSSSAGAPATAAGAAQVAPPTGAPPKPVVKQGTVHTAWDMPEDRGGQPITAFSLTYHVDGEHHEALVPATPDADGHMAFVIGGGEGMPPSHLLRPGAVVTEVGVAAINSVGASVGALSPQRVVVPSPQPPAPERPVVVRMVVSSKKLYVAWENPVERRTINLTEAGAGVPHREDLGGTIRAPTPDNLRVAKPPVHVDAEDTVDAYQVQIKPVAGFAKAVHGAHLDTNTQSIVYNQEPRRVFGGDELRGIYDERSGNAAVYPPSFDDSFATPEDTWIGVEQTEVLNINSVVLQLMSLRAEPAWSYEIRVRCRNRWGVWGPWSPESRPVFFPQMPQHRPKRPLVTGLPVRKAGGGYHATPDEVKTFIRDNMAADEELANDCVRWSHERMWGLMHKWQRHCKLQTRRERVALEAAGQEVPLKPFLQRLQLAAANHGSAVESSVGVPTSSVGAGLSDDGHSGEGGAGAGYRPSASRETVQSDAGSASGLDGGPSFATAGEVSSTAGSATSGALGANPHRRAVSLHDVHDSQTAKPVVNRLDVVITEETAADAAFLYGGLDFLSDEDKESVNTEDAVSVRFHGRFKFTDKEKRARRRGRRRRRQEVRAQLEVVAAMKHRWQPPARHAGMAAEAIRMSQHYWVPIAESAAAGRPALLALLPHSDMSAFFHKDPALREVRVSDELRAAMRAARRSGRDAAAHAGAAPLTGSKSAGALSLRGVASVRRKFRGPSKQARAMGIGRVGLQPPGSRVMVGGREVMVGSMDRSRHETYMSPMRAPSGAHVSTDALKPTPRKLPPLEAATAAASVIGLERVGSEVHADDSHESGDERGDDMGGGDPAVDGSGDDTAWQGGDGAASVVSAHEEAQRPHTAQSSSGVAVSVIADDGPSVPEQWAVEMEARTAEGMVAAELRETQLTAIGRGTSRGTATTTLQPAVDGDGEGNGDEDTATARADATATVDDAPVTV